MIYPFFSEQMDHTPIRRTGDVNCLGDLKDAIIQQKWSFFRSYDITDVDGLLNFAMQSAEARWYVETFLHLRYKKNHRHDIDQLFKVDGFSNARAHCGTGTA